MITLKSESDIQTLLDKPSHGSIIDLMKKDYVDYTQKFGAKEKQWIPRIIVSGGSDHEGSKIKYGFLLNYMFRNLICCFDVGIKGIQIAETTDEFLDLYNEIRHDPTIKNKQKGE